MPTAGFDPPQGNQSVAQIQDWIIKLCRDLDYYMNNLDDTNVNRLTAQKLFVSQLSAITSDMGILTAGIIYGAYIATANGTFPRIELNSVGNLLTAFFDATHSMSIEPNIGGAPGIGFKDPSGLTGRIYGNSGLGMLALINNIELTSLTGSIDMNAVSLLFNGVDVMAAINAKQAAFSGFTGTQSVITSVNFGASTTTSKTLHFTNGVVTSIT